MGSLTSWLYLIEFTFCYLSNINTTLNTERYNTTLYDRFPLQYPTFMSGQHMNWFSNNNLFQTDQKHDTKATANEHVKNLTQSAD